MEGVVVADEENLKRLKQTSQIIKDELNIKELKLTPHHNELLEYEVRPKPQILGKKHGRVYSKIIESLKRLEQTEVARLRKGDPVNISLGNSLLEILPEEIEVNSVTLPGYSSVEEGGLLVGVKTEITEELEYEGLARDIVRRIQALRKDAGFRIDDHIETYFSGDATVKAVFDSEGEYIAAETLSETISGEDPPDGTHVREFDIDGLKLKLGLLQLKR
jgi:isoleucyl-tRNA synthetase